MIRALQDNLDNHNDNYILPFLWLHGEEEPVLREMMEAVYSSGIGAVCVEARPHEDYAGLLWWRDMEVILDEARKRQMKVWVLDDKHFPTGYAAGRIKSDFPHLRKWYLDKRVIDAVGTGKPAMFFIDGQLKEGESLVSLVAYRRSGTGVTGEAVILTDMVSEGRLHWEVPEGLWRLFLLVQTREGGEEKTKDYLNPIVPAATDVLIDTVYQAHYEHFKDDFGDTLAGFFSDEPRFGNALKFFHSIGRSDMVLPWKEGMLVELNSLWEGDFASCLPLLWTDHDDNHHSKARVCYMDHVSRLYEKNFSGRLGAWCRDHGVEYIGHVIEDNNAHARLGWGTGHFFRALSGQDMSGIDIVLNQLRPGMDTPDILYSGGPTDGEFFHYGLAKLGASLGHLNPRHKGRIMCEIFGAFGWHLGLKGMKWMLDHMLVRGINHFVPHAFTAKAFPDPDCPPHFYGFGHNPQFPYFKHLMDYMNRMSHLLNGGVHVATAAVLYHAEAEWGGDYMLFQKPVRELMRNQIDCDIVCADMLAGEADVTGNRLMIHKESFDLLIVPYAEYLPSSLLDSLQCLAAKGLPLVFIEDFPRRSDSFEGWTSWLKSMESYKHVRTVSLENLACFMKEFGYYEIEADDYLPWLRAYHYKRSDGDLYLFFNESPSDKIRTRVSLPEGESYCVYNAMENRVEPAPGGGEGGKRDLTLVPGESFLLFTSEAGLESLIPHPGMTCLDSPSDMIDLKGPWEISLASGADGAEFAPWRTLEQLADLSLPGFLPDFSGTIRYRTRFREEGQASQERTMLDLGDVYETAEVHLNGGKAGVSIAPPYRFDITDLLREGENELEILVTSTLVRTCPDRFSLGVAQEPMGLLGPVLIGKSK